MAVLEGYYQKLLDEVDVKINGTRPWDITIKNSKMLRRILFNGSLGLGESYMDGWFDCEQLDVFFEKILRKGIDYKAGGIPAFSAMIRSRLTNLQSISRAYMVGEKHYDIGNDLFSVMLDKRMIYTCGYWPKEVSNLEESQKAKLDLVAKKLNLKPGMKVLDIGCGWGGAAKYFAETHNVRVIGITISKEQASLARETCAGLDVDIRLADYRELNEKFDAIYSIGMFEAVGYKNYRKYFKVVRHCLEKEGTFLLHTIGVDESTTSTDPWVEKYIFPNGMMPSSRQITGAIEGLFKIDDWHNFGPHYDKTIMCWHKNFTKHYQSLKHNYDERFFRMWTYWLLLSAASFRSRSNHLWQILLSQPGSNNLTSAFR
jgi:cyclopropane-fatty-acyl-phospholipid synthase